MKIDNTDLYIISLTIFIFGIITFSIAMELAKFVALVKWIFT